MAADVEHSRYFLWLGHCLDALAEIPSNYCDSVITDPPYHLTSVVATKRSAFPGRYAGKKGASRGFMGKTWDGGDIAFDPALWSEVLRVCKPGATMLAFGGTRTWHRLACAIEDAGWELRDTLMFLHGQGFPKGLNISKAIDAKLGTTRRKVGTGKGTGKQNPEWNGTARGRKENSLKPEYDVTAPGSPEAAEWDGWNVALKPAWEPIIVAMKPLDGNFASNALKWGVAGLNIDGARVPTNGRPLRELFDTGAGHLVYRDGLQGSRAIGETVKGRWPANVILSHNEDCRCVGTKRVKGTPKSYVRGADSGNTHAYASGIWEPAGKLSKNYADADGLESVEVWECSEGCPVAMLDAQSGILTVPGEYVQKTKVSGNVFGGGRGLTAGGWSEGKVTPHHGDTGGASRFFYTAKPRKGERHLGLADGRQNHHPTLKSLALLEYLCTLTATPKGGIVLDPFMGSGTAGMAALCTGRRYLGMELGADYFRLAMERIAWAAAQPIGTKLGRENRGQKRT